MSPVIPESEGMSSWPQRAVGVLSLIAATAIGPVCFAQTAPALAGYRLGPSPAGTTRSMPCSVVRGSALMCEASDSVSLTFLADTLVMIMYLQRSLVPGTASDVWRHRWGPWSERLFGPVDSVRFAADSTWSDELGRSIATRLLLAYWTSTWRQGWTAAVIINEVAVNQTRSAKATVWLKCNWAPGADVALCPEHR